MTNLPETRQPRSWLSELSDFFTGFPSWTGARPVFGQGHLIRLEDEVTEGHYLVRAELPGVDPAKDVDITVSNGQLTIKAERSEKKEVNGHSEFSYGTFVRTLTLPAGADEDKIKASYDKGILTVDVAVPKEPAPTEKRVPIETAS
jgi:HSP20 family molecular chaperone IbpA